MMQENNQTKVKISQIVKSQIPEYFLEGNTNFPEFLKQYYISQEYQGSPLDILENINLYTNVSSFSNVNLIENTTLSEDLNFYDETITVESTYGWPKSYGLLKIDDEIITYTGITSNTFTGCIRGFCGVESFNEIDIDDNFVFLDTVSANHNSGAIVENLSNLFLRKFFEDFKYQYAPGFEKLDINSDINTENLTAYIKDFYRSKGTDRSFKILFDILFGVDISITKPASQLFTPSDGQWVENRFLIVEDLTGDVRKIKKGISLRQDAKPNSLPAEGVVYYFSDVPKLINGKFYSKIGFDLETLVGRFSNTSVTKITEEVSVNSTSIFVDSTVGFPESGKLFIKTNSGLDSFTYKSKTTTQFLDCIGLGSTTGLGISLKYGENIYEDNLLYGKIEGQVKSFAVSNIVSGIRKFNTRYLSPKDKINIKSFGYSNNIDPIFTKWIYNIPNKYNVFSYSTSSSSNEIVFVLDTYENLYKNDIVGIITTSPGSSITYVTEGTVKSLSSNNIIIESNRNKISGIGTDFIYVRKKISKGKSLQYPNLINYASNVQNTYTDYENAYVSSSSIPDTQIETRDNSKTFSKSDVDSVNHYITLTNHNYFDGQLVYYTATSLGIGATVTIDIDNLESGRKYFIKKIDANTIALCFNKSSIYKNDIIEISTSLVTSSTHKLTPNYVYNKLVTSQNLLKSFPLKPKTVITKDKTPGVNGSIGLFLNGVEAVDSKSEYNVYYGSIENIIVKNSLENFDVVNPPALVISDDTGFGCLAYPNLSGSIKEVFVYDRGFRFLEDPKVSIIGGNGRGSIVDARITTFNQDYILTFSSSGINTTTDTITFDSNHNLVTGDNVLYSSNSQTSPQVIRIVGSGTSITSTFGTIGINTTVITGIDTSNIEVGQFAIQNEFIPSNTKVIFIGSQTVGIAITTKNIDIQSEIYFQFVSGISTSLDEINSYFVNVVSPTSIQLHYSNNDALLGINNVNFDSSGEANYTLKLNEPIGVIGDIRVSNGGFDYRNKKVFIDSQKYPPDNYLELSSIRTGINTFDNYIFAKNHRFQTGDIIEYSFSDGGTSIAGIGITNQYYVLKIDNNKFRLTDVGNVSIATTSFIDGIGLVTNFSSKNTRQFLNEEKYLKFSNIGVGTHLFKYPDIIAKVDGLTALGYTTLYQKVKCLGEIESVYIQKGGYNYGSETIFNYQREPKITTDSGSGAKINPIIDSSGKIVDYVIKRGGSNYVGLPDIIVSGVGTGAVLKPVVENGVITDIKILQNGYGYLQNDTIITIVPVGSSGNLSATFKSTIQSWNVNGFELHKKQMSASDDGVILESKNENYGNRYVTYSLPRELRLKLNDSIQKTSGGYSEKSQLTHSPIVGWAYDGNPIYGPYGYSSINKTSTIKRIQSGYAKVTKSNRPSISFFPLGFFNQDYEFVNTGDLDEHNGRFAITPEFPQGTYAYFCPISSINGSESFQLSREPVYPYIIGNTFRNEVVVSNFENNWDKSLLESKDTNLLKNLTPYNLDTYEFLDTTTSPKIDIFNVLSITNIGNKINSIGINSGGINYKIGDFIRFNEKNTGGSGCEAFVSSIVGKGVSSVVGINTFFYNVKFDYQGTVVTGITSVPHNFNTGDVIKVNSIRSDDELPENDITDSAYFKEVLGLHIINVTKVTSGIVTDIPSYSGMVGFTTFLELTVGDLTKNFQVGDIVGIRTENMLVLNVDDVNDRLRVLRGYNPSKPKLSSSSGIAYTTGDILELKSTKFSFNLPKIQFDKTVVNKRSIFFNPEDSVGFGTTGVYVEYSVGLGSVTNLNRRYIKEQRIYLPNHGLKTGDQLLYDSNPGIALSVSNSINLSNVVSLGTTIFAINRGKDFIGLSTNRVGLSSTNAGLYFVNIGYSGQNHEFTTNYGESLIGDIQSSYAIVSVGETHGLSEGDEVSLEVIPNNTITKIVKFDSYNKELVVGFSTISSSGITTGATGSSFKIINHGLSNGDKIIYESNNPALPLQNKNEYYVIKVDENKIRLAEYKFDAIKSDYEFIGLSTSGVGIHTISYINPKIEVVKGNILKFNLSDPSLSDFEFKFYYDKNFENEFVGTGTYFDNSQFETFYFGNPGTNGAYASINTNQNIPKSLYYSLKLKDLSNNLNINKIDFYPDTEVSNYCKILLKKSNFNITGKVFDTDYEINKFKISILPENSFETFSYSTTTSSVLRYTTTSRTALGSINEVEVSFGGNGYQTLPMIESIKSISGDNAQLFIESRRIGSINKYEVYNPTYEIPSDYTVRPILDFPIALKLKDNYLLSSVEVSSGGKGYIDAPKPIAIDSNGNIIPGLSFESVLSAQSVGKVVIIDNKNDLNKDISIISTNNANGYIIENASFNNSTKIATLNLDATLSQEEIIGIQTGTKVFIEGLESYGTVGIGFTTTTYNSSSNKYKSFEIVGINSISKSIDYVISTGNPGNLNIDTSNGFMILEENVARFSPKFIQGNFTNNETIVVTKSDGTKEEFKSTSNNGWNGKILKIRYANQFSSFKIGIGDTIFGQISLQNGTISDINESNGESVIDFSYVNSIGWEKDYGKLSVSNQKLSDNVYYQKMSYDIKSTISPTVWKPIVDSLNHTSGFKSFGSTLIVSEPQV